MKRYLKLFGAYLVLIAILSILPSLMIAVDSKVSFIEAFIEVYFVIVSVCSLGILAMKLLNYIIWETI